MVSGLLLASWGLGELIQPKNFEAPGVSTHFHAMEIGWEETARVGENFANEGCSLLNACFSGELQLSTPLSFIFYIKFVSKYKTLLMPEIPITACPLCR